MIALIIRAIAPLLWAIKSIVCAQRAAKRPRKIDEHAPFFAAFWLRAAQIQIDFQAGVQGAAAPAETVANVENPGILGRRRRRRSCPPCEKHSRGP